MTAPDPHPEAATATHAGPPAASAPAPSRAGTPRGGLPRQGRLRVALGALGVVVIAVGVGFLLAKAAGFAAVLEAIEEANWAWLPLCLAAEVAAYAGYVLCFRRVMASGGGPRIPPGTSTRVVLASLGATRIISPGGAGGLVVVFWALRRAGLSRQQSAARTLGLNTLLYGIWGVIAVISAALLLAGLGADVPLAMTIPWLVLVPAAVIAAVWVSDPSRGERLSRPPDRGWLRTAFAAAVAGVLVCRRVIARPRENRDALGGGVVYWAGDITCLWAALQSAGISVGIHSVALAYVTAYPAMMLPLPTGGFGALDAAATFTLTLLGVPLASAFVAVAVWRLFNFWLPTIPALVELVRVRDLGRALERVAPGTATLPAGPPAPA